MSERTTIAYVLKGFPRLSELFIASEIWRLERLGVPLSIHVLKPADENLRHALVSGIRSPIEYAPPTTSLKGADGWTWLLQNAPTFLPAVLRVVARRPRGAARAITAAFSEAVRVRRADRTARGMVWAKVLFQAFALADSLLRRGDVRQVHAHFAHDATTVAWLTSLVTGLPFSFTAHAKDAYKESLNPAGLLGRKLRAARLAITCTEATRKHLLTLEPGAAVACIHHGLNAELEDRLRAPFPAREAPAGIALLGVGRLVRKKGFDVLVEALALLVARGLDARLRLVGATDEAAAGLRAAVQRAGLDDRVVFVGPLTQDALLREYRSASCLALPCRVLSDGDRDGIPNVLVEAMACGLPVVTTSVGGIEELVTNGATGLLIPPDAPAALVDAIVRLHEDPALWSRLSDEGVRWVRERFHGEQLARVLAKHFDAPRDRP